MTAGNRGYSATGMAKWLRRGAEVLVWWSLLVGVWVLTLSSVATSEMLAATGSALLCAIAGVAAREAAGGAWRPAPSWAAWFVRLPVVVVSDTVRVLLRAVRLASGAEAEGDPGDLHTLAIPGGETGDRYAARQAISTIAVSLTPGTYVADVDEGHAVLLVHGLVSGGPSMEESVRR